MTEDPKRCGFCAIIGAPNAGKSTLVNALAGSKVSIVSRKAQTTRARLRAITIEGTAQIIFVDTPGIFLPKRRLDEAMVESAWTGAGEADAVLLLVDGRRVADGGFAAIVDGLKAAKRGAIVAINKVDLIERENLLGVSAALNAEFPFEATFMISALTGSGLPDLRKYVARKMPEGPWLYPEDQVADVQLRFMAAEITREKLYDRLHEELPYASTVETEAWEERHDGAVKIDQTIYVERDGQKMIVLGKGGRMIKLIGQMARAEMEREFERRVHLFLFVKVRENWANDPERLRMMGLGGS